MFKPITILALTTASALAQCAGGVCPSPPAWRWPTPSAPAAVCRVVHQSLSGVDYGSGVLVAVDETYGYVLTCHHVVATRSPGPRPGQNEPGSSSGPGPRTTHQKTYRLQVVFSNQRRFEAELVATDRPHDLALLRIANPKIKPIPFTASASSSTLANRRLKVAGFGSHFTYRERTGPVASFAKAKGATHPSTIIAATVRGGDSGGPVTDTQGRLVGIVWGAREGQTYAMCGEPVARVIAKASRPARKPVTPARRTPTKRETQATTTTRDELNALRIQIQTLKPCACDERCATRAQLAALARDVRAWSSATLARSDDSALRDRRRLGSRMESREYRSDALSYLFVALGISTPASIALAAVWWVARRRLKHRLKQRFARRGLGGPRGDGFRGAK